MDTLERRATILEDENADYQHRLHQLEADNLALQTQLKRFQQLLRQAGLHLVGADGQALPPPPPTPTPTPTAVRRLVADVEDAK